MKKELKKLHLTRETLKNLETMQVTGGKAAGAGTHYASVCWACDTSEDPCIPSAGGGGKEGFANPGN